MTNQEFTIKTQQFKNLLFSYALRLTQSRQDAEDLVQETTIKAYRYRESFTAGTNYKSWICTIMRNTFINNYRKRKSRMHINQPVEEFSYALESQNAIPNEAEHNLRMKSYIETISSLKEIYSVPFMLFYQGYEYQEIAEQLNVPIGTVKSRIFVARQQLKQKIKNPVAA
ncbi:RNA polymerase sigma factor [Lewinella sp. W8]|uniref:RNA polymerase sigma factor n=1 Tax=Lewinella sp. W8 TaxID=2528208 RepID=UPI0010687191|nr:sigma-70 family RNA polymerase sigma factor [Lewinella sp. W8]MTB53995.1 sigma-70 family RNA polymerase sigma factor [Lewinella sp. W8]